MDNATVMLATYVKEKGIQISTISEKTGISYGRLWTSLSSSNARNLRADEFLSVCSFVGKNPLDFYVDKPPTIKPGKRKPPRRAAGR